MPNPLVLIHGYSDEGKSFKVWKQRLVAKGLYKAEDIHICSYRTLTNEVTIKDVAEGLDRALRVNAKIPNDQPFDAIVHSTGMLVLRAWLTAYGRHERIKRIIAIAPASFGSPLAHKGRSWLGAIFKGNREKGPDFMEAGNLVLDGLELGSRFTWDLAHSDLVGERVFYGTGNNTPYVFTFCGDTPYKGLKGLVTKANGTDGTVRWAGCALNARKITLDFTQPVEQSEEGKKADPPRKRFEVSAWPHTERANLMMPFMPVRGLNHGTILEDPSAELVDMVASALQVTSFQSYEAWIAEADARCKPVRDQMDQWQQFMVRARDERGDPITDYNLQLYKVPAGSENDDDDWSLIPMDVHSYGADASYRCFHVNLNDLPARHPDHTLRLEFMASTGTELLGYTEFLPDDAPLPPQDGRPTFTMDLTPLFKDTGINFFYPFTTTLIEIILNREPLPYRAINKLTWFMDE